MTMKYEFNNNQLNYNYIYNKNNNNYDEDDDHIDTSDFDNYRSPVVPQEEEERHEVLDDFGQFIRDDDDFSPHPLSPEDPGFVLPHSQDFLSTQSESRKKSYIKKTLKKKKKTNIQPYSVGVSNNENYHHRNISQSNSTSMETLVRQFKKIFPKEKKEKEQRTTISDHNSRASQSCQLRNFSFSDSKIGRGFENYSMGQSTDFSPFISLSSEAEQSLSSPSQYSTSSDKEADGELREIDEEKGERKIDQSKKKDNRKSILSGFTLFNTKNKRKESKKKKNQISSNALEQKSNNNTNLIAEPPFIPDSPKRLSPSDTSFPSNESENPPICPSNDSNPYLFPDKTPTKPATEYFTVQEINTNNENKYENNNNEDINNSYTNNNELTNINNTNNNELTNINNTNNNENIEEEEEDEEQLNTLTRNSRDDTYFQAEDPPVQDEEKEDEIEDKEPEVNIIAASEANIINGISFENQYENTQLIKESIKQKKDEIVENGEDIYKSIENFETPQIEIPTNLDVPISIPEMSIPPPLPALREEIKVFKTHEAILNNENQEGDQEDTLLGGAFKKISNYFTLKRFK